MVWHICAVLTHRHNWYRRWKWDTMVCIGPNNFSTLLSQLPLGHIDFLQHASQCANNQISKSADLLYASMSGTVTCCALLCDMKHKCCDTCWTHDCNSVIRHFIEFVLTLHPVDSQHVMWNTDPTQPSKHKHFSQQIFKPIPICYVFQSQRLLFAIHLFIKCQSIKHLAQSVLDLNISNKLKQHLKLNNRNPGVQNHRVYFFCLVWGPKMRGQYKYFKITSLFFDGVQKI